MKGRHKASDMPRTPGVDWVCCDLLGFPVKTPEQKEGIPSKDTLISPKGHLINHLHEFLAGYVCRVFGKISGKSPEHDFLRIQHTQLQ